MTTILFSTNSYNEVWDAATSVGALLVCYGKRQFTIESSLYHDSSDVTIRDKYLITERTFPHEYHGSFVRAIYRKAQAFWKGEKAKFENENSSEAHSFAWKVNPRKVYLEAIAENYECQNYITSLDMLYVKMLDILYMIKLSDYIKRNDENRRFEFLVTDCKDTLNSELSLKAERYKVKTDMVTKISSPVEFTNRISNNLIDQTFHDGIIDFSWTNKELTNAMEQFKHVLKPQLFCIECSPALHPVEMIDSQKSISLESENSEETVMEV
jgi:hypothetical protein